MARRLLYLDTNVFIYAIEGIEPFVSSASIVLEAVDRAMARAVTSELTLAEALVGPFRTGDTLALQAYAQSLTETDGLSVLPVTRDVIISSARLRAAHALKLADSIHVATALAAGCDAFLTNDDRLKGLPIEVIRLSDIA